MDFWWGHIIDTLYTDQAGELTDLIDWAHSNLYDVTVTRSDGTVDRINAPAGFDV